MRIFTPMLRHFWEKTMDAVLKQIERLPEGENLWLLNRRARVRRVRNQTWKVIPHNEAGRGDPFRFGTADSAAAAYQQVQQIAEDLGVERLPQ